MCIGVWMLVIAALIAGCEVGPDYHPPHQPMPPHWDAPPTTQANLTSQQQLQVERWWTTFGDPTLNSLVDRAVASNLEVEAATERLREARASLGITTAGLWPTANVNGSYTYAGTGRTKSQDLWRAGLDAAWELDIFGGTRRSVEAANANVQAAVEDRRDVLVTLLGEVGTDYILLRGQQQQVIIASENLEVQIRNVDLTRDKKKLGTGTELDIVQAASQVASTRAILANLKAAEQQTIYSLSILLALPPAALDEELRPREKIPDPPSIMSVGLPSDLLEQRPDIRRAERQLAAATAQIGVATADLFPKFSLTGDLAVQGNHISALGNWDNRSWSFGPSVTWPIFDAGRIMSNIDVQNALQAQALTAYKQTVLAALQEVQIVLVAYTQDQERRVALAEAVGLNQKAVELATQRYRQGLTDFLIVLDSERSLFASRMHWFNAIVRSARTRWRYTNRLAAAGKSVSRLRHNPSHADGAAKCSCLPMLWRKSCEG